MMKSTYLTKTTTDVTMIIFSSAPETLVVELLF